jgi:hypothetical protein
MPEMTPEELFNQFMEQQNMAQIKGQGQPMVSSESGLPITPQEQAALQTIKNTTVAPAPASVSSHLPTCPQCGQLHPPVAEGTKCPMAKDKFVDATGNEVDVDVNKYLTNLKNIVVSQIESKGIKDPNKLFQQLTVSVMKFLEGYNDEPKE